jgi:hypothetical protein
VRLRKFLIASVTMAGIAVTAAYHSRSSGVSLKVLAETPDLDSEKTLTGIA